MRLLYVTEQVPNRDPDYGNGSSMIPYEVIQAMPDEVRVTLLSYEDGFPVPPEIASRCGDVVLMPMAATPHGLRGTARMVWSAASPATWERVTPEARATVRSMAAQHDVTLIHGGRIAGLAQGLRTPVVIQVIDPRSSVVQMEAGLVTGWRAAFRRFKAWQALWLERQLPEGARLVTVGRADAAAWSARMGREVHAIANGFVPTPRTTRPVGSPTVCFVGSLSYLPNQESAEILVHEIAPLVWQEVPEARFVLAGRGPDARTLSLAGDRVEVLANVPSVQAVFHRASVAAFPDRTGLGVRNSVTEALAAGTPVVASRAAAREQPDHPLLRVTDTTEEFVSSVVSALQSPPPQHGSSPAVALRSWSEVAVDYVSECAAALRR